MQNSSGERCTQRERCTHGEAAAATAADKAVFPAAIESVDATATASDAVAVAGAVDIHNKNPNM